jgi:hypothetical protein
MEDAVVGVAHVGAGMVDITFAGKFPTVGVGANTEAQSTSAEGVKFDWFDPGALEAMLTRPPKSFSKLSKRFSTPSNRPLSSPDRLASASSRSRRELFSSSRAAMRAWEREAACVGEMVEAFDGAGDGERSETGFEAGPCDGGSEAGKKSLAGQPCSEGLYTLPPAFSWVIIAS